MKWSNDYRMKLGLIGFIVGGLFSMVTVCPATEYIWTQKADMPTSRWNFATCEINGKIYAFAG